jgi:hypothetical protein
MVGDLKESQRAAGMSNGLGALLLAVRVTREEITKVNDWRRGHDVWSNY